MIKSGDYKPWALSLLLSKDVLRLLLHQILQKFKNLKNANCELPKTPYSIFLWQSTRCVLFFNCDLLFNSSQCIWRYRWSLGFNIANWNRTSNAPCCWPRNKSTCRLSHRNLEWQSLSSKHTGTWIRPPNWKLQCHWSETIIYKKNAPDWFSSKTPNQPNWNNSAIAHWNQENPTKSLEFHLLVYCRVVILPISCHDGPALQDRAGCIECDDWIEANRLRRLS